MDKNEILTRIGQIRNASNLSARKLSLEIDRNESYINGLESKKELPPIETLLKIIAACDSTPTEFFYYSIADYQQDKEIIELLKSTTPERKSVILQMIKVK